MGTGTRREIEAEIASLCFERQGHNRGTEQLA